MWVTQTCKKWFNNPIYGSSRVGIDTRQGVAGTRQGVAGNTELELIDYTAPTDGITTHILGLKQYELVNHLGNVLRRVEPVETTTITDKKIPIESNGQIDHYVADITSATDYYPFGSPMDGRNFSSDKYRFGFNGKEKDDEVKGGGDSYDYGARLYDSRLCRFPTPDPIIVYCKKYPDLSTYQFAGNKPIQFIDLDGEEEKEGKSAFSTNLMIPEVKIAMLTKLLILRMQTINGSKIEQFPQVVTSSKLSGDGVYKNGIIYISSTCNKSFDYILSIIYHEYGHSINECNGENQCKVDGNGVIVQWMTEETFIDYPTQFEINRDMKLWDEMNPSIGKNSDKLKIDRDKYYKNCSSPTTKKFRYEPSNLALDEIKAYQFQLKGEKDGLYNLSDDERNDIKNRIERMQKIYERGVDYEKRHNLNPDGSTKESS